MKYVAKHGMSDLGQVKTVIEKAYESYAERLKDYSPNIVWKNDREANVDFTVMKKKIEATFAYDEQEVRIEGSVPFIFKPFEGKIERVIGEEIDKWLDKAKAGEM